MAWNGIFDDGVWSCGFDMDPTAAEIMTLSPAGAASNVITPFGVGFSWLTSASTGVTFGVNLVTHFNNIRMYAASMPATSVIIHTWQDVTANAAQVTLRLFNDGSLRFFLGTGTGTPIGSASATGLVSATTWVHLATKVKIAGSSTGTVELRVNGNATPAIVQASVTTQSTANAWVSGFLFASPGGSSNFDDWVMQDTTGASPLDTWLGNVRIVTDKPSGAGSHTQFTPTNPTNVNYTNVGNIPSNTAQYNADGTVNDIDSYAFPTIGGSPSAVLFLNHWYKAELDTAGTRTVVPGVRSGGSDTFDGTPQSPPNGTYKYFNKPWVLDPNTSAAWTVSNAQSAELSTKVNS